jgi:two-component system CheB/CheR fusion protein
MEALFEQSVIAQVVIDVSGNIVLANRAARRMFSIGSAELGRHLREADLYHRPAELRTPIERVQRERRPVAIYDVPWHGQENIRALDIVVSPLDGQASLVISFLDASRVQHLRAELENSRRELETAYEELQSTVEELETTNEEFQSTNEELETTNEELHSTNEELETMNEELQSTNEELETINNELRDRSAEVTELTSSSSQFSAACSQPSWCWAPRWRCVPGTGRPRNCGGCAATRSSTSTSSTWTSASRSSGCAPPSAAAWPGGPSTSRSSVRR